MKKASKFRSFPRAVALLDFSRRKTYYDTAPTYAGIMNSAKFLYVCHMCEQHCVFWIHARFKMKRIRASSMGGRFCMRASFFRLTGISLPTGENVSTRVCVYYIIFVQRYSSEGGNTFLWRENVSIRFMNVGCISAGRVMRNAGFRTFFSSQFFQTLILTVIPDVPFL